MEKYPEFVAVKLSSDVVNAARRQAQADDRSLSAYLRRIIAAAVVQRQAQRGDEADEQASA